MELCSIYQPDKEDALIYDVALITKTNMVVDTHFFMGCIFQYVRERHAHSNGPNLKYFNQYWLQMTCII